jgi:1-deoxy-D-xylulose 5-phosphate reductoisomerase
LSIPVLIAALAGLIAMPRTLIRLHYTRRQTLAKEEGLITDRINAAVLGLGAEKTVKFVDSDHKIVEQTLPNIEVRIGALLSLGRT